MDIQEIFYYTATIAMVLAILFFLGMVVLLFYIKKKISDLDAYGKSVIHKADTLVDGVKNQVKTVARLRSTILGKTTK